MNGLIFVAILAAGLCLCQGATTTIKPHHGHHHTLPSGQTHGTHPTKESGEKESFFFQYSPHTHKMYVKMGHMCYVVMLSADEQTAVHTDSGIRALELKVLQMLATATQVMKDTLDPADAHACGSRSTSFYMVQ